MERIFWVNDLIGILILATGLALSFFFSTRKREFFRLDIFLLGIMVASIFTVLFSVFVIPSKFKIKDEKCKMVISRLCSQGEKIKYDGEYYYFTDIVLEKFKKDVP